MNHDDLKIFSITKKAVGDITNRIISFISVTIEEFYVNSTVHEILAASHQLDFFPNHRGSCYLISGSSEGVVCRRMLLILLLLVSCPVTSSFGAKFVPKTNPTFILGSGASAVIRCGGRVLVNSPPPWRPERHMSSTTPGPGAR